MPAIGSRAQVFHGTAHHTSGGLTKKDLVLNKRGRIVSRRRRSIALSKRVLEKAGYKPKKGVFQLFSKHSRKQTRKNRK